MNQSDAHLERALEESNDRVNALEASGTPEELLDAYVNRGCVLHMLGYGVPAMDDLESAREIAGRLDGVDPGLLVKMYTTMACIEFEAGSDPSEYYMEAIPLLPRLGESSRYYDRRSIIRMSVESAHDLLDSEEAELAVPFLEHSLSLLSGLRDPWSMNRIVELCNLMGEADDQLDNPEAAIDYYTRAVAVGRDLLESESMEEPGSLVLSLVSRADVYHSLGRMEEYVGDAKAAIALLQGMMEIGDEVDTEILISLHGDLADALLKLGRTEEAEKHLLQSMELGIKGQQAYLDGRDQR